MSARRGVNGKGPIMMRKSIVAILKDTGIGVLQVTCLVLPVFVFGLVGTAAGSAVCNCGEEARPNTGKSPSVLEYQCFWTIVLCVDGAVVGSCIAELILDGYLFRPLARSSDTEP